MYWDQKLIRDQIAMMDKDAVIARLAFLDTLLECDPGDLEPFGFTVADIKALKSKLISRYKELTAEKKQP
jgi:hypothetical protein